MPLVLAGLWDAKSANKRPGSWRRSTEAWQRDLLIYPALISLAAGLLAACTGQWPYSPWQFSAARSLASVSPPPSRPIRKHKPPSATDTPAPDAGGEVAARAEPVAAMPGPTSTLPPSGPGAALPPDTAGANSSLPKASELIGLDQPEATRLLGAAAEQFEHPPAMVWRYKNTACELDLYFYLDLHSNRMRTLHYAVKGNDPAKRQDCLGSLRVAQSK